MTTSKTDDSQNLWHGTLNTSTDTLVLVTETKSQNGSFCDTLDGTVLEPSQKSQDPNTVSAMTNSANAQQPQITADKDKLKISTNCNILPKVHCNSNNNNNVTATPRPNQLSTNSNNNSMLSKANSSSATAASCATGSDIDTSSSGNNDNKSSSLSAATVSTAASGGGVPVCGMEESILILPEHRKLEISFSGKCETVAANTVATSSSGPEMVSNQLQQSAVTATPNSLSSMSAYALPYATTATPTNTTLPNTTTAASSQRRRRTSSSNSKRDAFVAKHINGRFVSMIIIL